MCVDGICRENVPVQQVLRPLLPRKGGGARKETCFFTRSFKAGDSGQALTLHFTVRLSFPQTKHLTQEFAERDSGLLTWAHVMALTEAHYAPVQGIGSTALKLACYEDLFKYRYTEKDEGYKKRHAETTKVPCLSRQTGVPWILVCLIIILSMQRVWLARLVSSGA